MEDFNTLLKHLIEGTKSHRKGLNHSQETAKAECGVDFYCFESPHKSNDPKLSTLVKLANYRKRTVSETLKLQKQPSSRA